MSPLRTVAGLRFRVPSPSVYQLEGLPLALIFQSSGWHAVDLRSGEIWNERPFTTVADGATVLATALMKQGVA